MNKGDPQAVAYPRSFSSIAASVGGLAIFLVLASALLVSQSIGSTVSDYFYGVGHSAKPFLSWTNSTVNDPSNDSSKDLRIPDSISPGFNDTPNRSDVDSGRKDNSFSNGSSLENVTIVSLGLSNNSDTIQPGFDRSSSETIQPGLSNSSETIQPGLDGSSSETMQPGLSNSSETIQPRLDGSSSETIQPGQSSISETIQPGLDWSSSETIQQGLSNSSETIQPGLDGSSSLTPEDANQSETTEADCDLYHGEWVHDPAGPLYTNNSCPVLSQTQNCQGNGRPDKDYESWRWKPSQCDLPRFDGRKFLELMRGKTLAFIGDSVARNQMESLLCILWQVEVPKNRGNKKMQRYYFRSTSTMIVRIWSSWLVHQTPESFDYAPEGVVKLHLDKPDEGFMQHIPTFDVVVLSSGHWFAKQSVYVLHDEIVGGQLWWPHKSLPMKVNNVKAFGISVETILTSMATHPNYTGLTIVRSFSPDHYEGGAWNTGGSCTGKVQPATKLVENGFTNIMHEKQVAGFNSAIKKITNRSKLKLMDITEAFGYRHDGHPGPYRNPDPNKITTRGPDGKPPPQDCLHWCMPGPVDTWNELVLEIIRREL